MNAMTEFKNLWLPISDKRTIGPSKHTQLEVEFHAQTKSVWTYMNPTGNACFSLNLLNEFRRSDKMLMENKGRVLHEGVLVPANYFVIASKVQNVFNYGGDLAMFVDCIKTQNRDALLDYAKLCVEGIYAREVKFNSQAITISLVQGEALGGGFELALTGNVIVAEESARMGFPEILFDLFPGMGAYSLLTRRVGMKKAEEMILSGKIYEARELYEMGIVDVLVPTGNGEEAVFAFIKQNSKRLNGMRAMYQCRNHAYPVSYDELMNITETWVDAALQLQDRSFKLMGRLVRAQLRQQEAREEELLVNNIFYGSAKN